MSTASDYWDNLQDELSRKTVDVIENAVYRHTVDASMSIGELRATLDALWGCGAGLLQRDVMDLITQVRRALCP